MFTSTCKIAEGVDRELHEPLCALEVGAALGVGDGLAAHRLDLVDHLLSRSPVGADTVRVAAQIVDHDLGAFGSEEQRMLAAEAAPGTGDDGHAAVECSHDDSFRSFRMRRGTLHIAAEKAEGLPVGP